MTIIKTFFNLLKTNNVILAMITGMSLILLGMHNLLFDYRFSLLIGTTILFSGFDSLGYRYILTRQTNDVILEEYTIAYRIIQISFQIILYALVATQSLFIAILCMFLWLCGVCDLLYYLLLKENYKQENITWLFWSFPMGWFCSIFKKPFKWQYLVGQSIISSLIAVSLIVLSKLGYLSYCLFIQ